MSAPGLTIDVCSLGGQDLRTKSFYGVAAETDALKATVLRRLDRLLVTLGAFLGYDKKLSKEN
jgi:hypothetical protein